MRIPTMTAIATAAVLALAACAPAADEPVADQPSPEEATAEAVADGALEADEAAADEVETDEPETDEADAQEADPAEEEAAEEVPAERVTAYVVGYHWGWAVFDEDGAELDVLEVPVGTEVELVAVNDHASEAIAQLPEPVAAAIAEVDWHERAHHDVMAGHIPDPESEAGMTMSAALDEAHDGHHLQDHGLMVTGIGEQIFLDGHAHEPERLVFTVDREGTFEFRCTEDCGFGHDHQRREMLSVA